MCGILAAEYQTLPEAMRPRSSASSTRTRSGSRTFSRRARLDGTLTYRGRAEDVAQGILSTLEGAMLIARPYGDLARFNAAASQLLASLSV